MPEHTPEGVDYEIIKPPKLPEPPEEGPGLNAALTILVIGWLTGAITGVIWVKMLFS